MTRPSTAIIWSWNGQTIHKCPILNILYRLRPLPGGIAFIGERSGFQTNRRLSRTVCPIVR